MRKFMILILCSVILLSVSSCNYSKNNDASVGDDTPSVDASLENSTINSDKTESDAQSNKLINPKYNDLINTLKTIITKRLDPAFDEQHTNGEFDSPNPELDYNWQNMLMDVATGIDNPNVASFGYAIKDLNNDGIDELLFLREDSFLLAVFTLYNDEPFLLDAFWYRYKGMILENGTVFVHGSNGAADYKYSIRQLNENSTEFTSLLSFGEDGEGKYYKQISDKKEFIDETEFNLLLSEYPYNTLNQVEGFIKFVSFDN